MTKPNQQGFTLIEILIYTVIFAIVGGMLTGILINATRVEQRESASAEVTSQLNFVMQTIGRLIRASSNIEINAGVATSTLKLRMRDSAKDPTYITLSGNAIQLKEGSSATTTLTSDRVVVNTLSFKKFTQYPGHDTVSIDLTLTYNTQNTAGQVQRTLSSAIARVSAATFDSDVLPGGTYNYNLGQTGSPWQKIIMADGSAANPSYTFGSDTGVGIFRAGTNILGFTTAGAERMRIDASGNVGIGTTTPSALFHVQAATTAAGLFKNTGNGFIAFDFDANRGTTNDNIAQIRGLWNGTEVAQMAFRVGDDTTGKDDGYILFRTGENGVMADRMRITQGGNVGIGTTTPKTALDVVSGRVRVTGNTVPSDGFGLELGYDATAEQGIVVAYNRTTSAYKPVFVGGSTVKLYGNNGTAGIDINASGNVGIGTSTPSRKLHVIDNSAGEQLLLANSTPYNAYLGVDASNLFHLKGGLNNDVIVANLANAVVSIGTTINTGTSGGDLVLKHGAFLRSVESGDTGTQVLIGMDFSGNNRVLVGSPSAYLLIRDSDISAGVAQRVSVGANDSGGAGYRVLRVPN